MQLGITPPSYDFDNSKFEQLFGIGETIMSAPKYWILVNETLGKNYSTGSGIGQVVISKIYFTRYQF